MSDPDGQPQGGDASESGEGEGNALTLEALHRQVSELTTALADRDKAIRKQIRESVLRASGASRRAAAKGAAEDEGAESGGGERVSAPSSEDLKAEIRLEMMLDDLPEELRSEVEEVQQESGARAALRLARMAQRMARAGEGSRDGKSASQNRNPVRAGSAAQPEARRQITMSELMRSPPSKKPELRAKIKAGEIELL